MRITIGLGFIFGLVQGQWPPLPFGPDIVQRTYQFPIKNTGGIKRRQSPVTWSIDKPSAKLAPHLVRRALIEAFAVWSRAIPSLKFVEVFPQEQADIKIGFYRWDHGNHESFDGPCRRIGNQLHGSISAHAGYPPSDILHFDDSEEFLINEDSLARLSGISHLDSPNSIMNAVQQPRRFKEDGSLKPIVLSEEDVQAAKSIYGPFNNDSDRRSSVQYTISSPSFPTSPPVSMFDQQNNNCPTNFDSAVTAMDGVAYFFRGHQLWMKPEPHNPLARRFPTERFFPQAPTLVSAAITSLFTNRTYLFGESSVFAYSPPSHVGSDQYILAVGYPKNLSTAFLTPKNAFRASNGALVLFEDSNFIIWNEFLNSPAFRGNLTHFFPHFPKGKVSLSVTNDILLFINGSVCSQYNTKTRQYVESPVPLNTFLSCSASNSWYLSNFLLTFLSACVVLRVK